MTSDPSIFLATLGLPPDRTKQVLASWEPADSRTLRVWSMLQRLGPDASAGDWPVGSSAKQLLRWGLYSPLQLIAQECGVSVKDSMDADFPFLFGFVGLLTYVLIRLRVTEPPSSAWPPRDRQGIRKYSALYQSIFRLREQREEREPLSIEVRLPLNGGVSPLLPLKRFAQVVGRGVGVAAGDHLATPANPEAEVTQLFRDHKGAPASRLYRLDSEFEYLGLKDLCITLRRDGLVTLASKNNPLLDFYDGGWHVVDLEGGRRTIDRLLARRFGGPKFDPDLPKFLIRLAYHMATHWHGGILAVVDSSEAEKQLHPALPESNLVGGSAGFF